MSPFQRQWSSYASRLGLSVSIPFSVPLDDDTLSVPVLLRQFGARNGMLLLTETEYEQVWPHKERIVELGYGYSCLTEPQDSHGDEEEALLDMLRDWGWSGDGAPPAWLRNGAE